MIFYKILIFGLIFNYSVLDYRVFETKFFNFYISYELKEIENIIKNADYSLNKIARELGLTLPSSRINVYFENDILNYKNEGNLDILAGYFDIKNNLIKISTKGDKFFSINETFKHELSHYIILSNIKNFIPRWFIEGLAIYQSGENLLSRLKLVVSAASTKNFIPISELVHNFPDTKYQTLLAYGQSAFFFRYLVKKFSFEHIRKLLNLTINESFYISFIRVFNNDYYSLFESWKKEFESENSIITFFSETSILWFIISLLFLISFLRIRSKRKKLLEKLDDEREFEINS